MVCFTCGRVAVALLFVGAWVVGVARADEPSPIAVTIKDHRFTPSEIDVPAGKEVVLAIRNEDPSAEEFDLSALGYEQVIAARDSGIVRLPALQKGRLYPFVGDYHSGTARGVLAAE